VDDPSLQKQDVDAKEMQDNAPSDTEGACTVPFGVLLDHTPFVMQGGASCQESEMYLENKDRYDITYGVTKGYIWTFSV
jgi:hypothetical protein